MSSGLPGNVSSYNIAPGESSDAAAIRRKIAYELMKSGMDTSPVRHWTQGAARVAQSLLGGWELNRMDQKDQEQKAQEREGIVNGIVNPQANMPQGTQPPISMPPTNGPRKVSEALYTGPAANGWNQENVNGQVIAVNQNPNPIPSPLDPPNEKDMKIAAALVQAEAGNQGSVGQQAVAAALRNRAAQTGLSVPQVAAQPGQFESVGSGSINKYGPGTPGYDKAVAAVERAYTGDDPTRGAVNFYAPGAQASLARKDGRPAVAKFDNGNGVDIGDQRFFSRADPGQYDAVSAQSRQPGAQPAEPPLALRPGSPEALTTSGGMTADQLRSTVRGLLKQGPAGAALAQDLVKKWNESQVVPTNEQKTAQFIRQNWQQLGFKGPDDPDLAAFARQKLSGLTTPPGETEQEKKLGAYYGDMYSKIGQEATKARSTISTLRSMDQLMKNPNFYSGAGADANLLTKRVAAAFGGDKALLDLGMDPTKAGPQEAFRALSNKAIYDSLGSLGTGISNGDRSFIENAFPNLSNTPQGNAMLIKIQQRMEERKVEIAQAARNHNNGRLDAAFEGKLDAIGNKPLFSDKEMQEIQTAASGAPKPDPQGGAANGNTTSSGVKWSVQ